MTEWVMGSVDWAAVSAVVAVLGFVGGLCGLAFKTLRARPRARTRRREDAASEYLTQLKVTAKAIHDAAEGRTGLPGARAELTKLSDPEERLRQAFGHESTVHWVARLNREMLRRAFDIASGKPQGSYSLAELVALGVDEEGIKVFEREREAAMKRKKPVHVFATQPMYLNTMADMAQLPTPQREQFRELLARLFDETGQ
jgi:hypothetical protein